MKYKTKTFTVDRQFLFFLIQNMLISVFDKIDQSFGNHLDIDSICMLSSYTVVTMLTYSAYSFGSYAFRSALKYEKECLVLQISASMLIGTIIFAFADNIANLYSLTLTQTEMLCIGLKIHGISCPVLALREYLGNYAEYKCLNKIAAIGNIILYSSMILTDILVITIGSKTLTGLLFWTPVCSLLYAMYMWYKLKLIKTSEKFSWHNLSLAAKNGFNLWINRITGRMVTFFAALFASKLSTIEYSVHSVCYSAAIFGESVTNALHTNIIIRVRAQNKNLKESWATAKQMMTQLSLFSILTVYALCYIVLLFLHGKAPFEMSMAWGCIYFMQVFVLLFYETTGGCLIGSNNSDCVRFGGLIGIITRMLFIFIGWRLGFRLIIFALMSTVDFSARGLYFYVKIKRKIMIQNLQRR